MKDFNIAKYLREHQLGSYGILNHYVDLKPLKENATDYKITVIKINPGTFCIQVDWKYGLTTATAKTAEEAEEIKDRLERAFAAKKIQSPIQIAQYAYTDNISEEDTKVPYKGANPKLTGMGEEDEFKQAQTVSEIQDSESEFYDRIWDLAGNQIKSAIDSLRSDGFEDEDIKNAFMTAVDQYDQVFPPMEEEWYPNDDVALEKGRKKIVKEE